MDNSLGNSYDNYSDNSLDNSSNNLETTFRQLFEVEGRLLGKQGFSKGAGGLLLPGGGLPREGPRSIGAQMFYHAFVLDDIELRVIDPMGIEARAAAASVRFRWECGVLPAVPLGQGGVRRDHDHLPLPR